MAVYRCAGHRRLDAEGGAACDHEAPQPWTGRCPKCRRPYDCVKVGAERGRKRELLSASASAAPEYVIKHIPCGVDGFDEAIGGGVVPSQSILFAGGPGSRKSAMSMLVLDGLTHRTERKMLYASAEQSDDDLLALLHLNRIEAHQIKVMGNAHRLEEILEQCERLRPFAAVFDSLHMISEGASVDAHAKRIVEYSKKTGMISILISHVTKNFEVKGSTGPSHYVDTVVTYEPYKPSVDGDPVKKFGRQPAYETIGYNDDMKRLDLIEDMRVMVGGVSGKSRYGKGRTVRRYFLILKSGEMVLVREKENQASNVISLRPE